MPTSKARQPQWQDANENRFLLTPVTQGSLQCQGLAIKARWWSWAQHKTWPVPTGICIAGASHQHMTLCSRYSFVSASFPGNNFCGHWIGWGRKRADYKARCMSFLLSLASKRALFTTASNDSHSRRLDWWDGSKWSKLCRMDSSWMETGERLTWKTGQLSIAPSLCTRLVASKLCKLCHYRSLQPTWGPTYFIEERWKDLMVIIHVYPITYL